MEAFLGRFLVGRVDHPAGAAAVMYETQQMEFCGTDRRRFTGHLLRHGPRAVAEFGKAQVDVPGDLAYRPVPALAQLNDLGLELSSEQTARRGPLSPMLSMAGHPSWGWCQEEVPRLAAVPGVCWPATAPLPRTAPAPAVRGDS